ncbi:MAG: hypothetical protein FOGNACKC_05606 [Anaerolineae bacterium]|nr:hypothetical protein [Anaerolineae bacterium]
MLASNEGQKPSVIAKNLRCASQTVRNVIHDFEQRGLACLEPGSNAPLSVEPVLTAEKREQIRAMLHQSPRNFGKPSSLWILSGLCIKKKQRDRLIRLADHNPDIALGFEDEVWWSRERQPDLHSWSEQEPLRLVQQQVTRKDPEGKAIACYSLYLPGLNQMLLRFVTGRPVSAVTTAFLAWLLAYFAGQGKRALFLIWDNAS